MLGRGVDQILPHPGKPQLRERYMRDATGYVRLAERVNGRIPLPVDWRWPWGEALAVLENTATDVCLINLETTITADVNSPTANRSATGCTRITCRR